MEKDCEAACKPGGEKYGDQLPMSEINEKVEGCRALPWRSLLRSLQGLKPMQNQKMSAAMYGNVICSRNQV